MLSIVVPHRIRADFLLKRVLVVRIPEIKIEKDDNSALCDGRVFDNSTS